MFSFVSKMKLLDFPGLQLERIPTDRGISDFDLFLTLYQDGSAWRGVFEFNSDLFSAGTAQDLAEAYAAMVREISTNKDTSISTLIAPVPLPKRLEIAVAATFTADTLEEVGNFWQKKLRWPTKMQFAPYNQVFQALMDPASELYQRNSLNVLLVRPDDWVRYSTDSTVRRETLIKVSDEFIDAARQAKLRAPLVVYLCPSSPGTPDSDVIATASWRIMDALAGAPGVTVLNADLALARYQLTDIYDAQSDEIGHIPYTRPWFVAMGTELMRHASSLQRAPYKVIALDCDNTLWRGVCGEEGARGVNVDAPYHALQEFVAAQAAAGMLLCLVSKNESDDVFRVFDENDGMLLQREHIIGHRVNWLPKSANLRALAAELQLGLDSFIFIDDNPVECAEVQAACPEVLTLCLPQDANAIPAFLNNVWVFDRHQVSAEDRKRADSYIQNRQRDMLRQEQGSFTEFLSKLALEVDLAPADQHNLARLAQLSQRTNQFNNSGKRYDEGELRDAVSQQGLHAVAVSVRDRFGDYGLVGALVYRWTEEIAHIDSFMLSCRVLGRGVEHRMLAEIGRLALARGLNTVHIEFKELPRNQPFRRFLSTLDGAFCNDGSVFALSAATAARSEFDPEQYGVGSDEESAAAVSSGNSSTIQLARQAALVDIAGNLRSVGDILAQLDQGHRRRRSGESGTPPQGKAELAIAAIWQEILRIDALGRDDNFFEVGGNSLLLVRVNADLIEHFGRAIPITTLFQFPTIASLAQHLDANVDPAEANARVQARASQARQQLQQRMQRLGGMRRQ
jgi:FkbH-like protein